MACNFVTKFMPVFINRGLSFTLKENMDMGPFVQADTSELPTYDFSNLSAEKKPSVVIDTTGTIQEIGLQRIEFDIALSNTCKFFLNNGNVCVYDFILGSWVSDSKVVSINFYYTDTSIPDWGKYNNESVYYFYLINWLMCNSESVTGSDNSQSWVYVDSSTLELEGVVSLLNLSSLILTMKQSFYNINMGYGLSVDNLTRNYINQVLHIGVNINNTGNVRTFQLGYQAELVGYDSLGNIVANNLYKWTSTENLSNKSKSLAFETIEETKIKTVLNYFGLGIIITGDNAPTPYVINPQITLTNIGNIEYEEWQDLTEDTALFDWQSSDSSFGTSIGGTISTIGTPPHLGCTLVEDGTKSNFKFELTNQAPTRYGGYLGIMESGSIIKNLFLPSDSEDRSTWMLLPKKFPDSSPSAGTILDDTLELFFKFSFIDGYENYFSNAYLILSDYEGVNRVADLHLDDNHIIHHFTLQEINEGYIVLSTQEKEKLINLYTSLENGVYLYNKLAIIFESLLGYEGPVIQFTPSFLTRNERTTMYVVVSSNNAKTIKPSKGIYLLENNVWKFVSSGKILQNTQGSGQWATIREIK